MLNYGRQNNLALPNQGGGGSTTTSTSGGGGTTMNYDPRIGNAALPGGIYGAGNRAYVRDVQNPELAQQQVANITSQNSPLMRNAQMQGLRRAGARGMLNSSMSAEAAQNAVIEAATPLALSDAQAYREAAGQNLQYLNQRDIAEMQNLTQREGQWASTQGQILANEAALQRQREQLAYSGEQAELARRYGFQMAGLENQFGTERDYRQNQFAEQGDWRQFQIGSNIEQQRFNYDMMARQWESQNQMRQNAYQGIFEANLNNPQEFDEYINSGMMEYWMGAANQYFNDSFRRIYGG